MHYGRKILLCASLPLICFSSATAEPKSKIGRLPDGQAYRTDAQGYQLMDHTAELEVTVDELRRQVVTLEDELIDRQAQIDRLSGQEGKSGSIKRSSATAGNSLPPAAGTRQQSASVACPAPIACNEELISKPYREQIARLQTQLSSSQLEIQQLAEQTRQSSMKAEQVALEAQSRSQEVVASLTNDMTTREAKISALTSEISRLRNESAQAAEALAAKASREAELLDEIGTLQVALEKSRTEQSTALQRARLADEPTRIASAARREQPANDSSENSPTENRVSIKAQLGELQKLIIKRKDLLDAVRKTGRGVTIQVQPLVARNGKSLDTLRVEASKLEDGSDSDELQTGLAEIKRVLEDDIATLKRLARV